ncbi:MAG TPA: Hsp20/alpha crystallin family protein [Campylobacteraceae bacterium]|jgi:HSP20 family molecular chaperone IbpA|nr:Hsp20/alpha crystallin family protein [Campylobacteraceae bacterium]
MNKNIIAVIGILLVGIIAYQAYLLGKKEAVSETKHEKIAKNSPKITVEIEKEPAPVHQKRTAAPATEPNATATDEKAVAEKIKKDFGQLIHDLFGNPQVKAQIQQNMQQMQQELAEGMNEFQKAIVGMTAQLQEASKQDPLLGELFQNFPMPKALEFEPKGNLYVLDIDVPGNNKSSVDVKVKKGFLIVRINQVTRESHEENGVVVEREVVHKKQVLVRVPEDALVEKLQTRYKNGKLEITIPKIPAQKVAA